MSLKNTLDGVKGNEICENNIAYTIKTCREVSNKIRKMKGIEHEYVIGEEVICRKYIKTKGKKFNVNFKLFNCKNCW